jgi:hypothetical protein
MKTNSVSLPMIELLVLFPYNRLPSLLNSVDCIIDINDDNRLKHSLVYGIVFIEIF